MRITARAIAKIIHRDEKTVRNILSRRRIKLGFRKADHVKLTDEYLKNLERVIGLINEYKAKM